MIIYGYIQTHGRDYFLQYRDKKYAIFETTELVDGWVGETLPMSFVFPIKFLSPRVSNVYINKKYYTC